MKKYILTYILTLVSVCHYGQVSKRPSIMILPSDNWCTERYFIQRFDNQGTTTEMTDYERAFKEDLELPSVISVIGGFLAEKGFPIKDAEQATKNLRTSIAEKNATESKQGASIAENALNIVKDKVKSDVLIQIGWSYLDNQTLQYTIETFDCYSGFRIPATINGLRQGKGSNVASILEKDIPSKLGDYAKKLQIYFDNLNKNGREIKLDIVRWSNWDKDFDTEFAGITLTDIIDDWVSNNTVGASYNLTESDENKLAFEQVHIPLYNDRGTALDARNFANKFRIYLKNTYGIPAKVVSNGLGKATVILGDNN